MVSLSARHRLRTVLDIVQPLAGSSRLSMTMHFRSMAISLAPNVNDGQELECKAWGVRSIIAAILQVEDAMESCHCKARHFHLRVRLEVALDTM